MLERMRGIGKLEGYDQIFEVAIMGPKGSFPFIAQSNIYLIVSILHIEKGIILD